MADDAGGVRLVLDEHAKLLEQFGRFLRLRCQPHEGRAAQLIEVRRIQRELRPRPIKGRGLPAPRDRRARLGHAGLVGHDLHEHASAVAARLVAEHLHEEMRAGLNALLEVEDRARFLPGELRELRGERDEGHGASLSRVVFGRNDAQRVEPPSRHVPMPPRVNSGRPLADQRRRSRGTRSIPIGTVFSSAAFGILRAARSRPDRHARRPAPK